MGIFDDRFVRLTDDILTEMGFEKIFWGSPFEWDEKRGASKQSIKEHTCWELYVDNRPSGTLYYFPDSFNGYVTDFAQKGLPAKNKVIGWDNRPHTEWVLTGEVNCRLDLENAITKLKNHLNKISHDW